MGTGPGTCKESVIGAPNPRSPSETLGQAGAVPAHVPLRSLFGADDTMHIRLLPLVGAGLLALSAPAPAATQVGEPTTVAPAAPGHATLTDDVPPKDDEKKNEVTLWVLDASGKG